MIDHTSRAHAVASTPFGDVRLDVSGSSDVSIAVTSADLPALPNGMAVDGVFLFAIRLASPVTRKSATSVSATAGQDGDPESGQWLDSMSFGSVAGVLQVAVRDDEWLATHGVIAEPVVYAQRGFRQVISEAPSGVVLYASVAWRTASTNVANDSSTWFAADLLLPG
ncbi:hypothetical protein NF701_15270 [Sphingomonadaceae bacterium OTU29THOMA1]|nr:hypothetical protein NF701_15270 [Sphingomonadaceae bacterium OTU29THOMA1]